MTNEKTQQHSVCMFTGHRTLAEGFSYEKLREATVYALRQGVSTFYNGLAVGFDLLAAELILSLKEEYPQIRLVACIPCEGQDRYFSEEDKLRYYAVKRAADEVVVLAEHYYQGCMQYRDRYMAKKADCAIAHCVQEKSGTGYTLRYFSSIRPTAPVWRV